MNEKSFPYSEKFFGCFLFLQKCFGGNIVVASVPHTLCTGASVLVIHPVISWNYTGAVVPLGTCNIPLNNYSLDTSYY
jgi:hypothetical protein